MDKKYTIFVASSIEGIDIARAVQSELQYDFNVTLWNQGVFAPSISTLESLVRASKSFDFGIFVFSPDDIIEIRDEKKLSVRDNVLFELGIFFTNIG